MEFMFSVQVKEPIKKTFQIFYRPRRKIIKAKSPRELFAFY